MTVGVGTPTTSPKLDHRCYPQDFAAVPVLKKLCLSNQLARALDEATITADIVHNHSLWLMPNIYPATAAARRGKPFVVSPRGTFAKRALEYSSQAKRLFWAALQGPAVRTAACFHATSYQEYLDIRRASLVRPVAIIPNGVDVPDEPAIDVRRERPRTLLYLGRLHRIKGLDLLLHAWNRVANTAPDWRLRIVGPDEARYRHELERLANELGAPRVEFAGARYGSEKTAEFGAAQLFILPSHTENFGMSVAEALAQGTPVITTTGTPWIGIRDHGCGWYVDPTADALESALREALLLEPAELAKMGQSGREWMVRDFAWSMVAKKMEMTYRWLIAGGAPPDFVRLD
jgi:glycosyltransferase involved in cell wall biosynthesis